MKHPGLKTYPVYSFEVQLSIPQPSLPKEILNGPFRLPTKGQEGLHLGCHQQFVVDHRIIERLDAVTITGGEEQLPFRVPKDESKFSTQFRKERDTIVTV